MHHRTEIQSWKMYGIRMLNKMPVKTTFGSNIILYLLSSEPPHNYQVTDCLAQAALAPWRNSRCEYANSADNCEGWDM